MKNANRFEFQHCWKKFIVLRMNVQFDKLLQTMLIEYIFRNIALTMHSDECCAVWFVCGAQQQLLWVNKSRDISPSETI